MRTVDPASWPIHPFGTLVAVDPPAINPDSTADTYTARIIAVGTGCQKLGSVHAGRLAVIGLGLPITTLRLPNDRGVVLLEEALIIALLPD